MPQVRTAPTLHEPPAHASLPDVVKVRPAPETAIRHAADHCVTGSLLLLSLPAVPFLLAYDGVRRGLGRPAVALPSLLRAVRPVPVTGPAAAPSAAPAGGQLGAAVRDLADACPLEVALDVVGDIDGHDTATVGSEAAHVIRTAVEEALTNAARHSGSGQVSVVLEHTGDGVRAMVWDDGLGGADADRGTGLRRIGGLVTALGGVMAITSPPGGPTMVAVEVPREEGDRTPLIRAAIA
ncbi:ATP-binding protein [Streptomyces sp. NPDC093109]|uniref:sensor histidine kinase n=1 Tax=Streptomyces sp. NPDC093109 TaxID=3154977 RepID=UPI00344B0D45